MKYAFSDIKKFGMKDAYNPFVLLFFKPTCTPLIWFVVNFTSLTPNMITSLSLILVLVSALFFLKGFLIFGAVFFFLGLCFDWIDGVLARLTRTCSDLGMLFDHIVDTIRSIVMVSSILLFSYSITKENPI